MLETWRVENTRLHDRLAEQRDEMCYLEEELANCRKENKGLLEKVAFAEETATRQFNQHTSELGASELRVARLKEENKELKATVAKLQKNIIDMVATASYSFQVFLYVLLSGVSCTLVTFAFLYVSPEGI